MAAGLVGTTVFAAIPATALDLPLVQRLPRSPRFRVRVPVANRSTIAASPGAGADERGQHVARAAPRRARVPMPRDNWTLNTVMVEAYASLNRRQTIMVELAVACLHLGMIGFDDAIELEAQRL
jgi:hypothetical protein